MKKLLGNRKALSPVVAAIILIAVTVAVSIAVAAWMGALTFTFMKTEELKILNVSFEEQPARFINITVQNTGTTDLVINEVKAGGKSEIKTKTILAGQKDSLTLDLQWVEGTTYEIQLLTATGNKFLYRATAPQ